VQAGASTTYLMRFPGQWEDGVGYAQNYFRSYISLIGRYSETDPLGALASTNSFAYVSGNVSNFFDEQGLLGSAPSPLDHFNPVGLNDKRNYQDYRKYFEKRFPGALNYARKLLTQRIKQKACAQQYSKPSTLPALDNKYDDVDINARDYRKYGDEKESHWERDFIIGDFQIKTLGVTLSWEKAENFCPRDSCFKFYTTMYVIENAGENRGGASTLFKERAVIYGFWPLQDRVCCGK
jgi:RHS repeat-associated protein